MFIGILYVSMSLLHHGCFMTSPEKCNFYIEKTLVNYINLFGIIEGQWPYQVPYTRAWSLSIILYFFSHALPSFYLAWFTSNLITDPNRCNKQFASNVCSNSSLCFHKWVFDLQLFCLRCLKSSTQMDGSNNIEKS